MKKIELTDFLQYQFLSGIELSPDKKQGLFLVKSANVNENNYDSDLWLFQTEDKTYKQMTTLHDIQSAFWLDDSTILFSADRNKDIKKKKEKGEEWTCFYALSINGGEACEYMQIPLAVSDIKVMSDRAFALTAVVDYNKTNTNGATLDVDDEKDYEVIDEIPFWENGKGFTNKKRSILFYFNENGNKLVQITDEKHDAHLLDVLNSQILYTVREMQGKMLNYDALYEYNVKAKKEKEIVQNNIYSIHDGGYIEKLIYFEGNDMSHHGLNQNSAYYLVKNGTVEIWHDEDISYGNSVGSDCRLGGGENVRVQKDALYFTTTEGFQTILYKLFTNGTMETINNHEGAIDCFDVANDDVYFIGLRNNDLQELYYQSKKAEVKITNFNTDILHEKYVAKPEHFTYQNDGVTLDGFVLKPIDYDATKKYPAILDIHGGPKTAYGTVFYHEMQVWANKGYFVLYCNPRGGDGKGDDFADIRGKYGTIDYEDTMKFVDVTLEKYSAIDSERIGVTGGSYGGFMTNWIIGHTNRFKCAASQRSISNWVSMAYTTDIGYYFAEDQVGATPWNDVDKVWKQSPLKYADKVTTPTLFIHSEEDYRCWLPEGLQMFSALKYHNIPARLCMFKGENHELSRRGKPKHRARRLEEMTNWFDKYLQ